MMRNRAASMTLSVLLTVVFAVTTLAGGVLTASRASAVFHDLTETGAPGHLVLALDAATPLQADLAPGDSMRWLVQASLRDAATSTLAFELQGSGTLLERSGMLAEVAACAGSFDIAVEPVSCEGSLSTPLTATPLTQVTQQGDKYELAELRRDSPRELLVTLTIPASTSPEALAGQTARIGLGVHASGDGEEPPSTVVPVTPVTPAGNQAGLAVTGQDMFPLGLLAVGLMGLGAVAALRSRRTPVPGTAPAIETGGTQ